MWLKRRSTSSIASVRCIARDTTMTVHDIARGITTKIAITDGHDTAMAMATVIGVVTDGAATNMAVRAVLSRTTRCKTVSANPTVAFKDRHSQHVGRLSPTADLHDFESVLQLGHDQLRGTIS